MNKKRLGAIIICMLLFLTGNFLLLKPMHALAAQKVSNLEQMEEVFKQSIKKGKNTVTFQSPAGYSITQIQSELQNAAKSQGRMLAGSIQVTRQTDGSGRYNYRIDLSDGALIKVKILKSRLAAVKAAAKALKSGKYSTKFYSDVSYYDVFRRLLQQHPEYNYDTSVWRSSNGAYGYQRSNALTKKQQDEKMGKAEQAAAAAVEKCVKPNMTDKQKARAIHNYIIKNCQYLRTQNSFTAYGALVDGTAVCQGYAAAFNLMASKCGLKSMTVCGIARGGAHAWTFVKLGGKYRYIDCTWDDTGAIGKGVIYTYFNVTEEKMRLNHTWNAADFPAGDIKYYKYFT